MTKGKEFVKDTIVTAILVDGGFYRRRAYVGQEINLQKKELMNQNHIVKDI